MRAIKQNTVDFLARYKESQKTTKKEKKKRKSSIWTLLIIVSLVIVLGITGFKLYQLKFVLEPKLNELTSYSNDENNQNEYYAALELFSTRDTYVSLTENYQAAFANIDSYPELNDSVMSAIQSAASGYADITGMSYDHDTGYLVITFTSNDTQSPTQIASSLSGNSAFSGVYYYGYESTGNETAAYTFDIACVIAAPDGGESNG